MMMRFILLGLVLMFVQPALALGLNDAVEHALQTSARLAGAQAGQEARSEDENIAKALLLPNIQLTGSFQHIRQKLRYQQNISFLASSLRSQQSNAGISIVQPLFHYDRLAQYQRGKVSNIVGELQLNEQRQLLRLAVIHRYLDTLQATSEVARQQDVLDVLQQLYAQSKAAFSVGTVSANDRLNVQSQLDLAQADMLARQHHLRLNQENLSALTQFDIAPLDTLREAWVAKVEQDTWLEKVQQGNASLQVLQQQLVAAQLKIKVDLGTALPSVDLVAGYDWAKQTASMFGTGSTIQTSYIGLNVSMPLYAGGGAWSKLRQTKKQLAKLEYQSDQLILDLRLQTRALLQGMYNAQAQSLALGKAEKSAKQAYRAAQISFEVGLKDLLEVLDAQARLSEVQDKMNLANINFLKLKAELYYLAGVLDEQHVEKISHALNPS